MADQGKRDAPAAKPAIAGEAEKFLQMDFRAGLSPGESVSLARVDAWCKEALEEEGKVAGLAAISRVADAYLAMDSAGREAFLGLLARDYSIEAAALDDAIDAYRRGSGERPTEITGLLRALESPRLRLFRQFNTIPESIKFLVDLRADIIPRARRDPSLELMAFELTSLLESWFNLGFLRIERITWHSPAALLEKLIAYEAVHAISNWMDLKRRLARDRACFAFVHPSMPVEPIIFLEVALVRGIAGNLQRLLDPDAPTFPPHHADTAIFYGITNAQQGLRGIPFGNLLIKQVAARLRSEVPNLTTFATLSPIPRFRPDHLEPAIEDGSIGEHFTPAEAEALCQLASSADVPAAVATLLAREAWHEDREAAAALEPGLLRAARKYLVESKRKGRAACPVAHFHASNGAILARLNWRGNTAPHGLAQSAGIMANYLYDLERFEGHQTSYAQSGQLEETRVAGHPDGPCSPPDPVR